MPLAPRPRTETALRDLRSNGGDCSSMAVGEGDLRLRLLCRRGLGGRFLGEEGKARKGKKEGKGISRRVGNSWGASSSSRVSSLPRRREGGFESL